MWPVHWQWRTRETQTAVGRSGSSIWWTTSTLIGGGMTLVHQRIQCSQRWSRAGGLCGASARRCPGVDMWLWFAFFHHCERCLCVDGMVRDLELDVFYPPLAVINWQTYLVPDSHFFALCLNQGQAGQPPPTRGRLSWTASKPPWGRLVWSSPTKHQFNAVKIN